MSANDWLLILSGDEVLPTDAPWPQKWPGRHAAQAVAPSASA